MVSGLPFVCCGCCKGPTVELLEGWPPEVAGTSDVFKADLALATMPLLIEDLTWKKKHIKEHQYLLVLKKPLEANTVWYFATLTKWKNLYTSMWKLVSRAWNLPLLKLVWEWPLESRGPGPVSFEKIPRFGLEIGTLGTPGRSYGTKKFSSKFFSNKGS